MINTLFIVLWIWSSPKISLLRSRPVCIRTLMLMNSLTMSQKYLGTLSASLNTTVDDQVPCFNDLFLGVLDQHAPLRTFKVIHKKSKVISPDIKKIMQQRDDAHELANQTSKLCKWEAFRVLRRKVKSAIKSSERQLIRNKISKSRDNKTSIWKTVRNCLNPGGRSILPYSRDCTYVAHEFNHFLVISWWKCLYRSPTTGTRL